MIKVDLRGKLAFRGQDDPACSHKWLSKQAKWDEEQNRKYKLHTNRRLLTRSTKKPQTLFCFFGHLRTLAPALIYILKLITCQRCMKHRGAKSGWMGMDSVEHLSSCNNCDFIPEFHIIHFYPRWPISHFP